MALQERSIVTTADGMGRFEFTNVALAPGDNAFTVRAMDAAGNASFFGKVIQRLVGDVEPPVISARLANDTAPGGGTNSDGITSDPVITGTIMDASAITQFRAGFDATPVQSFFDVFADVQPDGRFSFNRARLEQINGGPLADSPHTLHLQAADEHGNVSSVFDVFFTLDTTAPALTVEAPLAGAQHSDTARLIGTASAAPPGIHSASYALDGGPLTPLPLGTGGRFDQSLGMPPLAAGAHQVFVEAFDVAGNATQSTVAFDVSADFLVGPAGSEGWGVKTATTVRLEERNSFLVQTVVPVTLGQAMGTRKLQFDVDAHFDTGDATAATEDRILVYLVNPANPSQTLLDRGQPGTALFALADGMAEFTPGQVRFDGTMVEIDVTDVSSATSGLLVFQLVNGDTDTGSVVQVRNIADVVDPEGTAVPVFPMAFSTAPVGAALNLASLTLSQQVQLLVRNVHLDAAGGRYTAELQVRNTGSPLGRQVAVVFPDLPTGVQLLNATGVDDTGAPYINFHEAIPAGGLDTGATSDPVQVVFNNPNLLRFALTPTVLVGSLNRAPVFTPVGPLMVMPGDRLEVPLMATDPDGDRVMFSIRSAVPLPTSMLRGDGTLILTPAPGEEGIYNFTLVASDGMLEATQDVMLTVAVDPVTTTRISGVIKSTSDQPLAGVPIELGSLETMTAADGSFLLESAGPLTADTLKVRGEAIPGPQVFPFIAEKLLLLLGHDVYEGVNNVISRPIFLPPIDVANAHMIDPAQNVTVTTTAIPGASVFVGAGTLQDQQGGPYTGPLSITAVPTDLTPAALPPTLFPDMVVTIQPGEMKFTTPAPMTLPNRGGYAPGTMMDLWSINPITGDFDNVGTGRVSANGSVINTITGGIRNSSWHFFAPPPDQPRPPEDDPNNEDDKCDECKHKGRGGSEIELHSGAVIETHDLVSYQSLGVSRGLTLTYDSLRADPRPILHLAYDDVPPVVGPFHLVAQLSVSWGSFTYQVPGFAGGQFGLTGGEHIWTLPESGGDIGAALQMDLRSQPSGQYRYDFNTGIRRFNGQIFTGSSAMSTGTLLHVNTISSPFGSGWGLAGLQELVENPDGSVLLIDGGGGEVLFDPPQTPGGPFVSPPGDFSVLERLPAGTFRRTLKDQTVFSFNARNQLESVRDRNGNETQYLYDGLARLITIRDPVGLQTTFTYTGNHVSAITDPAGRITRFEYDGADNLIRVIDPDMTQRTWEYDVDHHMTAEIDKRANREETAYGFHGRAISVTQKDGSMIHVDPVQVGALLRPEATIDPLNPPQAFVLGAAESNYADGNGNVIRTLLDQAGQEVLSIDTIGRQSTIQRNQQNLVTRQTDARGNVTAFIYDERGNVITISDEISGLEFEPTVFWVTNTDGDWNNPANWSTGQVPGPNDDVLIDRPGVDITVTYSSGTSSVRSLRSTEAFRIAGGSFTVTNSSRILGAFTIDSGASLTASGIDARFTATGSATINGANLFALNGGIISLPFATSYAAGTQNFADRTFRAQGPGSLLDLSTLTSLTGGGGIFAELFIEALGGGQVNLSGVSTIPSGNVQVLADGAGSTVDLSALASFTDTNPNGTSSLEARNGGAITLSGGTTSVTQVNVLATATGTITAGTLELSTGSVLSGFGTLGANVTKGGEVRPGTTPGILTINGNYTQTSAGILRIEIGGLTPGTQFDQLKILGSATLVGTLDITRISGFVPAVGNTFTIMTFASSSGNFATVNGLDLGAGRTFQLNTLSTSLTLTVQATMGMSSILSNFIAWQNRMRAAQVLQGTGTAPKPTLSAAAVPAETSSPNTVSQVQIAQAVTPVVGPRRFTYEPVFNQLTSETDELGRQTLYEIDPTNGNVLSITRVVGTVEGGDDMISRFTYTVHGLLDTTTDPLGRIIDNDYDAFGRLIATTFAKGTSDETVQRFEYDTAGNLIARIDENGNRTEFQYDDMNQLVKVIEADPDGVGPLSSPVTRFSYDQAGNLETTIDARNNTSLNEYDPLDRLTKAIDADGQETVFEYDQASNLVLVVDPLHHQTQNRYDARNRLIETVDAEGGRTQFRYDLDDNLTSVIDPVGNRTRFLFDARNRLEREVDPLNNSIVYSYDAVDNLVRKTDRNGRTTEFEYDELDRLIQEAWAGTTQVIHYSYDGADNLTSVSDNFSALAFTHDNRDRVKTVDNAGTPSAPHVVLAYAYDPAGNVISVSNTINGSPGGTNAYTHDALNRTTQITQTGPGISDKRVDLAYNDIGQFASINRYADLAGTQLVVSSAYDYDALNRVTRLEHGNTTSIVAFYDYQYDVASRISRITDIDGTTDYAYGEEKGVLAPGEAWERGKGCNDYASETFRRDSVGNQSHPVERASSREASLAWRRATTVTKRRQPDGKLGHRASKCLLVGSPRC